MLKQCHKVCNTLLSIVHQSKYEVYLFPVSKIVFRQINERKVESRFFKEPLLIYKFTYKLSKRK